MQLQSIKYVQYEEQPNEWDLDRLDLLPINLIVGRNASGKTKTLNVINSLARLLSGEVKPNQYVSCHFDVTFKDGDRYYYYNLVIQKNVVVKEVFSRDQEKLLDRGEDGRGTIRAEKEGKDIEFQPPNSELAFSRTDLIQHPYFDPVYQWAKSTYHYGFGTFLGRNVFSISREDNTAIEANPKNDGMVVNIYKEGEQKFGGKFKEAIIADLHEVDYHISDIGIDQPSQIVFSPPGKPLGIWVSEKDLKSKTEQFEISQGMFRVLSLIIQLNYLKMSHKPSCILIDDIGEGLDYERSCALIKLIIKKAQDSQFQLIMATNDRFVMNNVPLEMWTVLNREGNHCRVVNIKNSKEKFEEFRFTGLSNFDFFASDFFINEKQ
jgi:energy-coupling factor transporter ATP-binding protein EcfA2